MRKIIFVICLLVSTISKGNDGAYYASGNHLIPIEECDISVKKEILNIVKKEDFIYVTVDYTFYNPVKEKTIIVGFEAPSPNGDVNGTPVNGGHPYMYDFKVIMNGEQLDYKKAIVLGDNYFKDGKVNSLKVSEVINEDFDSNYAGFYYVYHFKAKFKKGENKVIHTYKFKVSGGIAANYDFDYILTAANRWANKQIDDFTLYINMGDDTYFDIENTFCESKDWTVENGRKYDAYMRWVDAHCTSFVIDTGGVTLKKQNFSPKGELSLTSLKEWVWMDGPIDVFDSENSYLLSEIEVFDNKFVLPTKSIDEKSFKILRNLPFAIKGYVFKTKFIQDYYLRQPWYHPNPNYKIEKLSGVELEWYNEVLKNKWTLNFHEIAYLRLVKMLEALQEGNKEKLLQFFDFPMKIDPNYEFYQPFFPFIPSAKFQQFINSGNRVMTKKDFLELAEIKLTDRCDNLYNMLEALDLTVVKNEKIVKNYPKFPEHIGNECFQNYTIFVNHEDISLYPGVIDGREGKQKEKCQACDFMFIFEIVGNKIIFKEATGAG